MMKRFFADVCHPDVHGTGIALQLKPNGAQTAWGSELPMISVTSIFSRL